MKAGNSPRARFTRREAVNRKYARFDAPLRDGDEVVFIPPVSGG
jgi:molybdopterin converting factor small subunit